MSPRSLGGLSINQKTLDHLSLPEAVRACVEGGVDAIGVWREPLQAHGVEAAARLLRDTGMRVSSLCRGGFLTAQEPTPRSSSILENVAAIHEAAAIEAACLVLVVGGLPPGSTDLGLARERVVRGLDLLAPIAEREGVQLALEPMHPLFAADRGVLSTLDQALDIAQDYPADVVSVVVDTYHVWWDPQLYAATHRASGRIASFQVADWVVPFPHDALNSRGLPGEGSIAMQQVLDLVRAAGYTGDVEVEVFNPDVWSRPAAETISRLQQWWAQMR